VDPKSGEILETTLVDLLGNVTVVIFSKVETNRDPPASVFHFDPPAGVKVLKLQLESE
jgi:outer membrane lipoprotein-sorting protein